MIKIEIPLKLPSLNEYIRACRNNKYAGAKFKANIEEDIMWYINSLPKFERPVKINFTWIEGNKKRDIDNVAFAKFPEAADKIQRMMQTALDNGFTSFAEA